MNQEIKSISKRVSDLEESLAFAQEQIAERDERLYDLQQNTAESIAEGIAKGVEKELETMRLEHQVEMQSKDEEMLQLKVKNAKLEAAITAVGDLTLSLSAGVMEGEALIGPQS